MVGAVEQGDFTVLGQVPEQPGVVIIADMRVLPDPAVGDYGEQAIALAELQHMGGIGGVGPGVGQVFGVEQVVVGVEVDIGRGVFVFQVQLSQVDGRGWF